MTEPPPLLPAISAVVAARTATAWFQRRRSSRQVGGRIILVLIVALALTAIGFSVIGLGWGTPLEATESNDGKQAVDTAAFQEKERSIPQAEAPATPTGEPARPPTGDAPNVNAPVTSVVPSTR